MRLKPYFNGKNDFNVRAVGDKLLTKDGIRYLLFFESDEKFDEEQEYWNYPFRMFLTKNGFHAIGYGVHDSQAKIIWLNIWRQCYPDSDYTFDKKGSWSWLHPHSLEELQFIATQATNAQLLEMPQITEYYRDKAVFERLGL